MPHSAVVFYAACLVCALDYMHSLNIAYRDMKQENVMLDAHGYAMVNAQRRRRTRVSVAEAGLLPHCVEIGRR